MSDNLVQNHDFENNLIEWMGTNTKSVGTGPDNRSEVHSGLLAAGMGFESSGQFMQNNANAATLWQDVKVEECVPYELHFWVAGRFDEPADMHVRIQWLDANKNEIGVGLDVIIPEDSIGNGSQGEWNGHYHITDIVPEDVVYARILFVKDGNPADPGNFVVVDNVYFTKRCSSRYSYSIEESEEEIEGIS